MKIRIQAVVKAYSHHKTHVSKVSTWVSIFSSRRRIRLYGHLIGTHFGKKDIFHTFINYGNLHLLINTNCTSYSHTETYQHS
jgi:hypothetical protein